MSAPTARVAVVIPTHGRADRLPALVRALEAQTLPADEFEVVIVQDGGLDDTAAVVEDLRSHSPLAIRFLRLEENRGPAWARNHGWRSSGAQLVAFTDDDTQPAPGWLAAGVRALEQSHALGIVQGRTLPDPDASRGWWSATRQVESLSWLFEGCNLFARRAALEASGGFDEQFGYHAEDTSFGWNVVDLGWNVAYEHDALVFHDVTEPGFRWHLERGFAEGRLVAVAARHPAMRRKLFWRPWAFRRRNAAFALALVGALMALRWRWAIALVLPYVAERPPRSISRAGAELLAKQIALDSAVFAGMSKASVEHRVLVL